jgi:hypothetical protein
MLLYIKCNKKNIDEILKELDNYNMEWIDGGEKPSKYNPYNNENLEDDVFLFIDYFENGENEFKEGVLNLSFSLDGMTRFIDRRNYIECENIKDLKEYLSGYKL